MKRLFVAVTPALLLAGFILLYALDKAPTIVFQSSTRDFGKVTEGQTLKHVFKFTNKGTGTLEILSAEAS